MIKKLQALQTSIISKIDAAVTALDFDISKDKDRTVQKRFSFEDRGCLRSYETGFSLLRRINAALVSRFGNGNFSYRLFMVSGGNTVLTVYISEQAVTTAQKYVVIKDSKESRQNTTVQKNPLAQ